MYVSICSSLLLPAVLFVALVTSDPVIYIPPMALHSMDMNQAPFLMEVPSQRQLPQNGPPHFMPLQHNFREQPMQFTTSKPIRPSLPPPIVTTETPVQEKEPDQRKSAHSAEIRELLEALGVNLHHDESNQGRTADFSPLIRLNASQARDYDYPPYYDHNAPYYHHWPQPYSYSQSSYQETPHAPPVPHLQPYPYSPPSYLEPHNQHLVKSISVQPKVSLLDLPKLPSISKLGSLLEILKGVMSGSLGPTLNGLPSQFIGGVVKSLKTYVSTPGGLKTLIAKVSIPLLALVLINVEVLAIVWWLWDDCSESPFKIPVPASSYHYAPAPAPTAYAPPPPPYPASPYPYKY